MDFINLDENGNIIEYEDVYSDSSKIPSGNNKSKNKHKKKKKSKIRKLIKSIIIIFIGITLLISAFAWISGYTREDFKRNKYISSVKLNNNLFITNILLLGTDGSGDDSQRTDTMLLVSVDFIHQKIKLTSFLRDCWVYIPEKDGYSKLNAAYSYAGANCTKDTIEYNFGIDIDHYVKVDFEMFTKIIDELGGIDIEITDKEASFINRTTRYTVTSGESVHLDGAKALVYSRIRKLDSDYMRTYRQRKVITSLINKLKQTDPVNLFETAQGVLPLIETDLSPVEISLLAYKAGIGALLFDIDQIRVPDDESMTTGYKGSQWVEIPDLEKCKEKIEDFIYSDNEISD